MTEMPAEHAGFGNAQRRPNGAGGPNLAAMTCDRVFPEAPLWIRTRDAQAAAPILHKTALGLRSSPLVPRQASPEQALTARPRANKMGMDRLVAGHSPR